MVPKMGHSQPRLGVEMDPPADRDSIPVISPDSEENPGQATGSKMGPSCYLIAAKGLPKLRGIKGRCRSGASDARNWTFLAAIRGRSATSSGDDLSSAKLKTRAHPP